MTDDLPELRDTGDGLLSTREVAQLVGISYRQVDYITRTTSIKASPGQGRRRGFPADVIHRIQVAVALNNVVVDLGGRRVSLLPAIADAVFQGPEPLPFGWAALDKGGVSYAHRPDPLFPMICDDIGAIVARVPNLWPNMEGP